MLLKAVASVVVEAAEGLARRLLRLVLLRHVDEESHEFVEVDLAALVRVGFEPLGLEVGALRRRGDAGDVGEGEGLG